MKEAISSDLSQDLKSFNEKSSIRFQSFCNMFREEGQRGNHVDVIKLQM